MTFCSHLVAMVMKLFFYHKLCKNVCVATVAMDMYSECLSLQTDAQYLEICSKEQRSHKVRSCVVVI